MYENMLTMDKAKTIEWVKLIDLWVFTKYGQGMIRIDSKKCYEMEFEKSRT